MQLNKTPLAIEENNYTTKIVNACIVHDLDYWQRNRFGNFVLKNCLFSATIIAKLVIKVGKFITGMDYYLMEHIRRVLVINLLEKL